MDVYCPRCGEPWDRQELRDEGITLARFARSGCRAFSIKCEARPGVRARSAAMGAIVEHLADDDDAATAYLSDFGPMI